MLPSARVVSNSGPRGSFDFDSEARATTRRRHYCRRVFGLARPNTRGTFLSYVYQKAGLDPASCSEGRAFRARDHEVVEKSDVDQAKGLLQTSRDGAVGRTGFRILARKVVGTRRPTSLSRRVPPHREP